MVRPRVLSGRGLRRRRSRGVHGHEADPGGGDHVAGVGKAPVCRRIGLPVIRRLQHHTQGRLIKGPAQLGQPCRNPPRPYLARADHENGFVENAAVAAAEHIQPASPEPGGHFEGLGSAALDQNDVEALRAVTSPGRPQGRLGRGGRPGWPGRIGGTCPADGQILHQNTEVMARNRKNHIPAPIITNGRIHQPDVRRSELVFGLVLAPCVRRLAVAGGAMADVQPEFLIGRCMADSLGGTQLTIEQPARTLACASERRLQRFRGCRLL